MTAETSSPACLSYGETYQLSPRRFPLACDNCRPLGHHLAHDLYYCSSHQNYMSPVVVAVNASDPTIGLVCFASFVQHIPNPLSDEAYKRAGSAGLLEPPSC